MFNQKEYLIKWKAKNKASLKAKRNAYERGLRATKNERYYANRRKLDKARNLRNQAALSDRYIKHFPEFRGTAPTATMIKVKRSIIKLKRTIDEQQRAIKNDRKSAKHTDKRFA